MDLDKLLTELAVDGASDIHLRVGSPPLVRRVGRLQPSSGAPLTAEALGQCLGALGFGGAGQGSDRSYAASDALRFRAHSFWAQGQPAVVLRVIPAMIPSLEELGLPPIYRELVSLPGGLVLVGGEGRGGKSTTLAALLQAICASRAVHLVVIEEPIEHLYRDQLGSVTQIEVCSDATSWESALESALRSDAEVIGLGELQGEPMVRRALQAAEMGFLVLAVASGRAPREVLGHLEREAGSDAASRDSLRQALAAQVTAVCCQRLVPSSRNGLLPLCEVMLSAAATRARIAQGRLTSLDGLVQSYDQHLLEWVERGQIQPQAALELADDKSALEQHLHPEPAS